MTLLLWLLLLATPFVLAGAVLGYLIQPRNTPDIVFLLVGLALIAFGIVGMASIGILIYPIGVLVFWMGMGRRLRRAREERS
jgi:hypothetical protein